MTYNKVEFGILNIYVAQILTLETDPRVVIVFIQNKRQGDAKVDPSSSQHFAATNTRQAYNKFDAQFWVGRHAGALTLACGKFVVCKINEAAKVLATCLSNGIPNKICAENSTNTTTGLYNGLVYHYNHFLTTNKVSKAAVKMAHFFCSLPPKEIQSGVAGGSTPSPVQNITINSSIDNNKFRTTKYNYQ